jgi:ABC-type transport system, involved in lipoprotein release, permease component
VKLPFYIARRYLFSRKSHNAINIISAISVCGVTLATLALICTLSVFNGFHDLVESMFTHFDPELKIEAAKGKTFVPSDSLMEVLHSIPAITVINETLEDQAMAQYKDRQTMVTVKGVGDDFLALTSFSDILIGEGTFRLADEVVDYGILGIQIPQILGSGLHFIDPLTLYAPRRGTRINLANPMQNVTSRSLFNPGLVFCVNQEKYDASYIVTSMDFARELFGVQEAVSALELRTATGSSIPKVKRQLRRALGTNYEVKDRYEQQSDVFQIVRIEKFISYLFLSFILLIACFNIIGSVSMLILDKQDNLSTLRSLGASDSLLARIFLYEGNLIALAGALLGLVLGVILCLLQQRFGFISLGQSGAFVVEAYPVSVHLTDVLLVFVTVVVVSTLAVRLPVRILARRAINDNNKEE